MTFFTYSECLRKTPNCDDGTECGWSQRAVWASHRPAVSKPATAHRGSFSIEHWNPWSCLHPHPLPHLMRSVSGAEGLMSGALGGWEWWPNSTCWVSSWADWWLLCVTAGLVVSQRCLVPCPQAPALSAWCQGPPHQSRCKLRLLPKVSLSVPPCTSVCTLKAVQLMLCTLSSTHGAIVTASKRGFKVFDPGWGQCVRKTYLNKHHHWSPLAPLLSLAVPNLTLWTLHSCVLLMRVCPSSLGQQCGGGGWEQFVQLGVAVINKSVPLISLKCPPTPLIQGLCVCVQLLPPAVCYKA